MIPPLPPTPIPQFVYYLRQHRVGQSSQQKKSSLRHCLKSDGCPCMYGGHAGAAAARFKRSTGTIPATLFFRLSDMHSKWLGQTCASLIRLFTLLLFFFPLVLPLPPQSLILENISTYTHSEICPIRGVQWLRLLCLCSVV